MQNDIPQACFLDLFAGSGAIGIEALSRGAQSCCFVDQSRKAVEVIKENLAFCRLTDQAEVYQMDAVSAVKSLANHEPFVSALADGVIWARVAPDSDKTLSAAIMGGYVQVLGERVIVLCDKTREIKQINADRLRNAIPWLEDQIANLREGSVISRSYLTRKLRWCKLQLEVKENEDKYTHH
jgi:16S rRNA G966 N2-methylase RsmD